MDDLDEQRHRYVGEGLIDLIGDIKLFGNKFTKGHKLARSDGTTWLLSGFDITSVMSSAPSTFLVTVARPTTLIATITFALTTTVVKRLLLNPASLPCPLKMIAACEAALNALQLI